MHEKYDYPFFRMAAILSGVLKWVLVTVSNVSSIGSTRHASAEP